MERLSPPGLNDGEKLSRAIALMIQEQGSDGKEFKPHPAQPPHARLVAPTSPCSPLSQQAERRGSITLNDEGTDKMIALTKNMRPGVDRIAIVLDGEVISAPVVNQVPLGKQFIIEGLGEPGEVQNLANSLMNPLKTPSSSRKAQCFPHSRQGAVVEQGLGRVSSALIDHLFVRAALLPHGRLSSPHRLGVNGIILFGMMAMFGFTFSLPGIAGMILTIGMAVDANVLIYERLREEMATGQVTQEGARSLLRQGLHRDFRLALHLAHHRWYPLLAWQRHDQGLRRHPHHRHVTASLFSAILVTRVLFRWGIDLGLLKKNSPSSISSSPPTLISSARPHLHRSPVATLLISIGAFGLRGEGLRHRLHRWLPLIKFQLGKGSETPRSSQGRGKHRNSPCQGSLPAGTKQSRHRHPAHRPLRHPRRGTITKTS
jgi:SecD/SecF fusion protein